MSKVETAADAIRLGVLTPSSNTVLEPATAEILRDLPNCDAFFSRFRVVEISDRDVSQQQFDLEPQLKAAELLADARVQAIVWSGTSASWLGFDREEQLFGEIAARTGVPVGSSVAGINQLLERGGIKKIALVTPYIASIQQQIIANYAALGIECVAHRHFDETVNFQFASFTEEQVEAAIREVALEGPEAVIIMCTNMRGSTLAAPLEAELGLTVIDSTSAAVWDGLRLAGQDPAAVTGWGRMFIW